MSQVKSKSGTSDTTRRVHCKCDSAQQDKMYGKGVRIANRTAKGDARCTVCGALHSGKFN